MRRLMIACCFIAFCIAALPLPAQAAPKEICFQQVPDCISNRFADYWTTNGGLAVFGLPLSPDHYEKVGDQKYKVQYFERARFEYHKGDAKPYDVLLGRIGVAALEAQGRDWYSFPKADPSAPHYFGETGHAIAPQFWGFWSSHGLEFDGNKKARSMAESLALFGLPVSEAQMEISSDGRQYLTQWFERARFEYHPENQAPYDVLLGLLGADAYADAQQTPDSPPRPPKPEKVVSCPGNAPAAAEGPQAWMADAEPVSPGTMNAVCARLTVNGAPVAGAQVTAKAFYASGDVTYPVATTGADGQAQIDFTIGKAKNRNVVGIEVSFKAPGVGDFTASTSFTPRYNFTKPYQPLGPVIPNIPAPAGGCAAGAPQATEGAHAWMTVPAPADPTQFDSICARLIVNGAPVANAKVNAVAYRYGKDAPYGPATTDANGFVEIGFPIANSRGEYIVFIDVMFRTPDGKNYTAVTAYRPTYAP